MPEDNMLDRPIALPWLITLILAPPIGAYKLFSEYADGALSLGGNPGSHRFLNVAENPGAAKWVLVVGILVICLFEIVFLLKLLRFIRKTGEYTVTEQAAGESSSKSEA